MLALFIDRCGWITVVGCARVLIVTRHNRLVADPTTRLADIRSTRVVISTILGNRCTAKLPAAINRAGIAITTILWGMTTDPPIALVVGTGVAIITIYGYLLTESRQRITTIIRTGVLIIAAARNTSDRYYI